MKEQKNNKNSDEDKKYSVNLTLPEELHMKLDVLRVMFGQKTIHDIVFFLIRSRTKEIDFFISEDLEKEEHLRLIKPELHERYRAWQLKKEEDKNEL